MLAKLQPRNATNPHRIVLFCTQAERVNFNNCVVEFAPHTEIRCNGTIVNANLRGIKNKPGTVNPPDLTPQMILMSGVNNKIDVTFADSKSVFSPLMLM
jgi:E3 SUMO-protein ligase PIAS1